LAKDSSTEQGNIQDISFLKDVQKSNNQHCLNYTTTSSSS